MKAEGTEQDGLGFKLKARLCVHGTKDAEKDSLRTDAAVASHEGFRLTYSIASKLGFILGKGDISGAYPQSGTAKREIYVTPPRCVGEKHKIWLLLVTFYGILTAGTKWQRASDGLVINQLGFEVVIGISQLFRISEGGKIQGIIAKYVDDMLVAARTSRQLAETKNGIMKSFTVGQWVETPDGLQMNSTEVLQHPEEISLSMPSLAKEIEPVKIFPGRRKQITEDASQSEVRAIRSVAGKLGYLGIACSPIADFAASFLQQCIPKLTIGGPKSLNGVIRDARNRLHEVKYLQPSVEEQGNGYILAFSDAGYPHTHRKSVRQEGSIIGIAFGDKAGSKFHTLTWMSRKQRRVSTSTASAETIAAVSTVGLAMYMCQVYQNITGERLPVTLAVDSKALHRTLATHSQPRDRAMVVEVHRLRLHHMQGDLDKVVWIPGVQNPADPLTKPLAGGTTDILEEMLATGRLVFDVEDLRNIGVALREEA